MVETLSSVSTQPQSIHLKGIRIYFQNLRYFYSRNSNPDLPKKNQKPYLWIRRQYLDLLILNRGRRVGGWTHHEGTYHLLRERERYGLCRLLPNGPDADHLLGSPVIYQREAFTFSSLLATENTSHLNVLRIKKNSINHTRNRPSERDSEPLRLTGLHCDAFFKWHFKA